MVTVDAFSLIFSLSLIEAEIAVVVIVNEVVVVEIITFVIIGILVMLLTTLTI